MIYFAGKQAKFIKLMRNRRLLMVEGYTFRSASHGRHWYCSKRPKGCKARVYLNTSGTVVIYYDNIHNHEPPVYEKGLTGEYFKISG